MKVEREREHAMIDKFMYINITILPIKFTVDSDDNNSSNNLY